MKGKNSQNMYIVTDKFGYSVPPKWGFLKSQRNTLDVKAKYDYYDQDDAIVPDFDLT